MKKKIVAAGLAAGLSIGGLAGAVITIPGISAAQTDSTVPAPSTDGSSEATARTSRYEAVLAPLVADGTITQAQADKVVAALDAARPSRGDRGGRGGKGVSIEAAATALGLTKYELRTELRSGKTIAQVATEKGIALTTVTDAMVKAYSEQQQAEVATGEHTQAEVDAKIAAFKTRVNDIVNGTFAGPDGGRGGRGRHGDRGASFDSTSEGTAATTTA
jgi:hypothetical protein